MPRIEQLPPGVVNKIAAGEVIERPASVVKELVENAVDAGASRIDVSIGQGGSELIRVADNGRGIEASQLPLAVAAHATSKIRDADDLFAVATLGFRGEALASIAEISQFRLRSRPAGAENGAENEAENENEARNENEAENKAGTEDGAGAELEVVGGVLGKVVPCGGPVGTTVEVRNLFYNTPVRRKFLRTTQTEMSHCIEACTRIALATERIHFTLRHNDRSLLDLPPTDRWHDRIAALVGLEIAESLIPIEGSDGEIHLSGFVAEPNLSRANNRMQYVFLNGRFIRDRALQHALGEAYRGLLMSGRYPIAFIRLDMPAGAADVNVHPTKLEVRFQDSGRIYGHLLGTLRNRFLATDLTPRETLSGPDRQLGADEDDGQAGQMRRQFASWAKGKLGQDAPANGSASASSGPTDTQAHLELQFPNDTEGGGLQLNRLDRPWHGIGPNAPAAAGHAPNSNDGHPLEESAEGVPAGETGPSSGPSASALQVHNRYLITENEEGVVVIDQHALHERILYEELREKVLAGTVETQRLLVPETVHLTPTEAAAVLESRQLLQRMGIDVEPFGGDTVIIAGYPAMLANLSPEAVLRKVVEQLMSGDKVPDQRDLLDELLHTIACKAAIKAGDRLSPEEISALLQRRHLVQDAHHCPHGRPTALVFTREELDKRFKRI